MDDWPQVGLDNFEGHLDPHFLWKECGDKNEFRNISEESDGSLIWDVDKVNRSIPVVVQKSAGKEESQLWKITPQIVTVCCKAFPDKALGVENNKPKFICPKSGDKNQVYTFSILFMCLNLLLFYYMLVRVITMVFLENYKYECIDCIPMCSNG